MPIIDEKTQQELRQILAALAAPVRVLFFTRKDGCATCAQQEEILRDFCALSPKLKLEVYDFVLNGEKAMNYRIDKVPATAVVGEKDFGIRFYGLTAAYEFASLLEAVMMVSTGRSGLEPRLEELVKSIRKPVHMQVMTTLTCPYCPQMVHVAHQFAFVNDKITADMVETAEFPQMAQKYDVTGVPKTIVNETHSFLGALPAAAASLELLKAVEPEEYDRIVQEVRQSQEAAKTTKAEEGHDYELAIVGGGPAAMSAAIYAARKGLDAVLIAKELGGQIKYTAVIENYLGLSGFSGAEMADTFRIHMERHAMAEALGVMVARIEKQDAGFLLSMEDGKKFRARSVVYCGGKEYKRLGVPGEDRFIGKGIGFCATCDAPLYKGKRVVVVGGGNSAFTSVRDLVNFASEIHLVHRKKEFKADAPLVEEISKAGTVKIHTPMEVKSFNGAEKLTGVTLASVDGKEKLDLPADGVFLEIGLTPNSGPLSDLLDLNRYGEVPVERDQSTRVKGLFAAGDVTNVEEKQISVAGGQGAQAALSAYKYLVENKLTRSKTGLKDSWE